MVSSEESVGADWPDQLMRNCILLQCWRASAPGSFKKPCALWQKGENQLLIVAPCPSPSLIRVYTDTQPCTGIHFFLSMFNHILIQTPTHTLPWSPWEFCHSADWPQSTPPLFPSLSFFFFALHPPFPHFPFRVLRCPAVCRLLLSPIFSLLTLLISIFSVLLSFCFSSTSEKMLLQYLFWVVKKWMRKQSIVM